MTVFLVCWAESEESFKHKGYGVVGAFWEREKAMDFGQEYCDDVCEGIFVIYDIEVL